MSEEAKQSIEVAGAIECANCSAENREHGYVESWDGICPDCGCPIDRPAGYVTLAWVSKMRRMEANRDEFADLSEMWSELKSYGESEEKRITEAFAKTSAREAEK